MATRTLDVLRTWALRAVIGLAVTIIVIAAVIGWLLYDRPSLADIDWPAPSRTAAQGDSVTATWLGVTTVLFDDGATQVLIDGFFSRPSLADIIFGVAVESDAALINYVLDRYDMRRLAAIVPVHSHFDHALDIGAIANRSDASILGSESTAQIARGAGVPEDQIVVVTSDEPYSFGDFTVTLIKSAHAPVGWGGTTPLAGSVDKPLQTPAPITAWREGGSYSVVIDHPQGTTIVQGSAGFIDNALDTVRADVVMLGTYGLDDLGNEYARRYWQTLVTETGALRVFPIHFDDYTQPLGEVRLFPRVLDDFVDTAELLEDLQQIWDADTHLYLPVFGEPLVLYPPATPEA